MMRGISQPVNAPYTQLFILRGANLVSTADQAFSKVFSGTSYQITNCTALCKTGGATVACAGGIYTAAAKGGTSLIAAIQSWVSLTAAGKLISATLAAVLGTDVQTATPILSLTTGSSSAATADIYIYGLVLD